MAQNIEFNDISDESEELRNSHDITQADLDIIKSFGEDSIQIVNEIIDKFYVWLPSTPDYAVFFSDPALVKEVRKIQTKFWMDFFTRPIDEDYIRMRKRV